jgi:hypothetical protein
MPLCLHCAINDMINDHIQQEPGENDTAEIAAMIAQSLAEFILNAPKEEQAALLADTITVLGATFLDTSGQEERERPRRAH